MEAATAKMGKRKIIPSCIQGAGREIAVRMTALLRV
jgi:hypothetical protein